MDTFWHILAASCCGQDHRATFTPVMSLRFWASVQPKTRLFGASNGFWHWQRRTSFGQGVKTSGTSVSEQISLLFEGNIHHSGVQIYLPGKDIYNSAPTGISTKHTLNKQVNVDMLDIEQLREPLAD